MNLSTELVQKILTYLDTKPHREVRPLIDEIMQVAQAEAEKAGQLEKQIKENEKKINENKKK